MSKANRKEAAQRVVVQWQAALSISMIDAIKQCVDEAEFSKETFFAALREQMRVERIEDLRREQFLPVCKLINDLNKAMRS